MTARRIIPMLLALVLAAPAAATAQETNPERERAKQEAARLRLEEAQERLRQALEQLRRSRGDEANLEMQRAMDALRRAQRELQSGVYEGLLRDFAFSIGDNAVVLAGAGRPKMGVVLGDDTFRVDSAGMQVGVRITGITPGGPAEGAGIRTGDLIVSANGQALQRANRRDASPNARLVEIIGGLEEGDTLHVVYRRDGTRGQADVIVRPVESTGYAFWTGPEGQVALRDFRMPDMNVEVGPLLEGQYMTEMLLPYRWLSMELVELDPEAGQAQFGTTEGLLVVRPPRDSTLDLRAYDVILNVNGRVPTNPAHAIRIMRSYDAGETMRIEIMRNKRRQTITATVPDPREALRLRVRERRPE